MKKFHFLLFASLFSLGALAQTMPAGENISLDQQLSNVNQSSVSSGIIYERTLQIANLYNFNKYTTLNTANFVYFKQALLEMNKASNGTKFTTVDNFKSLIANTTAINQVDLAILNTQFHILNYNADNPTAGGLTYNETTQKFSQIAGKDPFFMLYTTVIAPTKEYATGSAIVYNIRNDLFFTNGTKTIKTLVANFGDEVNRTLINNQILSNQSITVNYTSNGEKVSTFNITYSDNTTITTYGKIFLNYKSATTSLVQSVTTNCGTDDPLRGDFSLTADIAFAGYNTGDVPLKAKIDYRMFYHTKDKITHAVNTEKKMLNPIIIIDGFDPGDKRRIEDCDCEADETDCKSKNTTNGQFDPEKHKSMVEMMIYYENDEPINLLKNLRSTGYDVIMVNQPKYTTTNPVTNQNVEIDGGADYIERNAMALVKLITNINGLLNTNGASANKISIVGPSMGGQISRYALAYMEKNNLPHNVKLWISVDSPHLGANIPLGDQALLNLVRGDSDQARDFYEKDLKSPAAQQQLIEYHAEGSSYNTVNQNFQNAQTTSQGLTQNRGNSFFQQHYNNQNANGLSNSHGWPLNLRKIAIVNGSLTGSKETQSINGQALNSFSNDGEKVINLRGFQRVNIDLPWPFGSITFSIHVASIEANNLPSTNNNAQIARLKKAFNDRTTQATNLNSRGVMDNVPGGFYAAQQQITSGAQTNVPFYSDNNGLNIGDILYCISNDIGGSYWDLHEYNPIHSFIPTFSSIAHLQPNQNWSNPLNTNLTCPSNKQTPFDSYFGLAKNTQHTSFTKESVAWLLKELSGQPQAPSFPIDATQFSGASQICINSTSTYSFADICKLPSNATWSVNSTNAQILSFTDSSVTLKGVTNGSVTLTATFQNGQTLTKKIWVGLPLVNMVQNTAGPYKQVSVSLQSAVPNVSLEEQGINTSTILWKRLDNNSTKTGGINYTFFAYGTAALEVEIQVTLTNSCGSITQNGLFEPNPSHCDIYNVAKTSGNTYNIIDPPCPLTPTSSLRLSNSSFSGTTNPKLQNLTTRVYNSVGNQILSTPNLQFSLDGQMTGVYYVKIFKNNNIVHTQTLLKN